MKFINFISKLDLKNYDLVLLNQIINSGSSFLVSLFLVSFLGLEKFGLFTVLWIIFLLINTLQLSVIVSPMMTNSGLYASDLKAYYYGGAFVQQIFLTLVFLILIKFFFFFGSLVSINNQIYALQNVFLLIIFTSQIYQFFRRFFLNEKMYGVSIVIDIIINITLFSLLIYFFKTNELNLEKVFYSYFISFLVGTLLVIPYVKKFNFSFKSFADSTKVNFKISKWITLTSIMQWFSGNLWLINSGIILGSYVLGAIRACQTITNICNLLFQSFENFFPPKLTHIYKSEGSKSMNEYIKKINISGFILLSVFAVILSLGSKNILEFFYGPEVSQFYYLLIFLSILLPFTFISFFYRFGLRTLMNTRPIFLSYLFPSIFTVIASKFIITNYNEIGFAIGLIFNQLIILFFTYYGYIKILNKITK
jgi:O-antigen/teichoic acid export membrane protein